MGKRFENAAGALLIIGLVLWYAGGSQAMFRLISVQPLQVGSLALVLLTFGAVFAFDRRGFKVVFGTGAVLAATAALCMWSAVPLANAVLDSSEVEVVASQILGFHHPSKGPRQVRVLWRETRVSLNASDAPGCAIHQPASLHVKRGAFGMAWITQVRCTSQNTQVEGAR